MNAVSIAKWTGSFLIVAAWLIVAHDAKLGYAVGILGNVSWIIVARIIDEPSITFVNGAAMLAQFIGLWSCCA